MKCNICEKLATYYAENDHVATCDTHVKLGSKPLYSYTNPDQLIKALEQIVIDCDKKMNFVEDWRVQSDYLRLKFETLKEIRSIVDAY